MLLLSHDSGASACFWVLCSLSVAVPGSMDLCVHLVCICACVAVAAASSFLVAHVTVVVSIFHSLILCHALHLPLRMRAHALVSRDVVCSPFVEQGARHRLGQWISEHYTCVDPTRVITGTMIDFECSFAVSFPDLLPESHEVDS